MKKLFTLLTIMLALALSTVSAYATNEDYDYETDGREATGTSTKLHKYFVVDKDINSPEITFNYSIAAGTAVAAAGQGGTATATLPVYAGLTPGAVKIGDAAGESDGKVEFAYAAATTAGTATDGITNDVNKKYATKDIILDFTGVTFDKPGVYRYVLTEATTNNENLGGVTYDVMESNNTKRTIDVYVVDTNGVLTVDGYVSYVGDVSTAPLQEYNPNGAATEYANGSTGAAATGISAKSNQYVNEFKANELKLEKEITGNQGDKESTWEMKINFETLPTDYVVKYALITDKGAAIDDANLVWADYTNNSAITLGHLDKYHFKGIPEGVKYTVTETKANQDGYKTTYTDETYTYPNDGTVETKDAKVENNRQGVIPTGILMSVTGGVMLIGIAAIALVAINRKKDEDYN